MFERILLAVDGSKPSQAAVDAAIELAGKTGAHIEVVHVRVHEHIASKAGSGPDLETRQDARDLVRGVVERVTDAGIPCRGTMREAPSSDVSREIIRVADEVHADTVVVGSRGLSNLSAALLGSVSMKLINHSQRPVVVVHGPAHLAREDLPAFADAAVVA